MNLLKESSARDPPTYAFLAGAVDDGDAAPFVVAAADSVDKPSCTEGRLEGCFDPAGVLSSIGLSSAMLYTSSTARECSFSVGLVIFIVVALAAASAFAEAISPPCCEMK